MPEIVIVGVVDDPGYEGLPKPDVVSTEPIHIAGIRDGMESGKPSLALALKLPDGRTVLVETSWRIFSTAHAYFEAKFGKADTVGMEIGADLTGYGGQTRLTVVDDPADAYFECELCGKRRDASEFPGDAPEEQQLAMIQWSVRHFKEKHPGWSPPA